MRTGGTFEAPSTSSSISPASAVTHSPWHSPIPYLFGGLAAMLGLIAFALLILACSYWKISGFLDNNNNNEEEETERDPENGDSEKSNSEESIKVPAIYEQKIVVIMAGEKNPTFLATPVYPKTIYSQDCKNKIKKENQDSDDKIDIPKEENGERVVVESENRGNQETSQSENRGNQETSQSENRGNQETSQSENRGN